MTDRITFSEVLYALALIGWCIAFVTGGERRLAIATFLMAWAAYTRIGENRC